MKIAILIFLIYLDFLKGLALNAQANPNIEKHQISSNDPKHSVG